MNNNVREKLIESGINQEAVDKSCQQLLSYARNEQAFRATVRIHSGYMGSGNRKAEVMVVSDFPSQTETETKILGFGDYSVLLTLMLNKLEIDFSDVYWTTAIKEDCERVNFDLIQSHHRYLKEEIISVNPTLIISLGATSISSLLNKRIQPSKIKGAEYNIHDNLASIPIIALEHPKAHIGEDTFKDYFMSSWKQIKKAFD